MAKLNNKYILRNVNKGNSKKKIDLIGFGDASKRAYGAYIYAIYKNDHDENRSHLICSKSRVAPLKIISLPRLELNAAFLLAKLSNIARKSFGDKIRNIFLWSDSTVVLSWIASPPHLRKIYVANRITKIHELTRSALWRYVPLKENPVIKTCYQEECRLRNG